MTVCKNCGTQNDESYRFCENCGVPLRLPQTPHVNQPPTIVRVPALAPAPPPAAVASATLAQRPPVTSPIPTNRAPSHNGCLVALLFLFFVVCPVIAFVAIQPGVFTVQPIGALPEGVTFIYYSRNPEMPFFSSPDSLCLKIQGYVSLLCRATALGSTTELTKRIIIKMPYNEWAYLQSTGGQKFDR